MCVCVFHACMNIFIHAGSSNSKHYHGNVVSPSAPRQEAGLYWGYSVRLASSFGAVFTEAPHKV